MACCKGCKLVQSSLARMMAKYIGGYLLPGSHGMNGNIIYTII